MFKRIFGKKKMEINNNPNVITMDREVFEYLLDKAETMVDHYGSSDKMKTIKKHLRRFNPFLREQHIQVIMAERDAVRKARKEVVRLQNNYKGKTIYFPCTVSYSPASSKGKVVSKVFVYIPCQLLKSNEEARSEYGHPIGKNEIAIKYDDDTCFYLRTGSLFKKTKIVSPFDVKTELPEGFIKVIGDHMLGGSFIHRDTIL